VRFKTSRCESWRTKRGGSWERVGVFWGEIHGVGKQIKGIVFVNNLGEIWKTKREDPWEKSKTKGWFSFGG